MWSYKLPLFLGSIKILKNIHNKIKLTRFLAVNFLLYFNKSEVDFFVSNYSNNKVNPNKTSVVVRNLSSGVEQENPTQSSCKD